jgi:hypothetical protein
MITITFNVINQGIIFKYIFSLLNSLKLFFFRNQMPFLLFTWWWDQRRSSADSWRRRKEGRWWKVGRRSSWREKWRWFAKIVVYFSSRPFREDLKLEITQLGR